MHLLLQMIYYCKTLCVFRSFRPSSGAQNCLYSNGICQTAAATCCYQGWDGTAVHLIPHSSSCLTYTIAVYAVLSSRWWTERPSKTHRAFYKNKSFETTGASFWLFYRNILRCKDLWILNGVISMDMIQCGKCGVYILVCKQMASTVFEYGVLCITHSLVRISFVLTIFESSGMLYLVEW
jgi:hypothetical protein